MISAVVLAAGLSSRMSNKNKLLLPYLNKTIVETTVDQVLAAGVEDVVVVTGRDAQAVNALLGARPVRLVYNPVFAEGLTGSIQAGLREARGNGFMICLADMVLVEAAEYRLLADAFNRRRAADEQCICVPVYDGQQGNPVIFSSYYRAAIASHSAPEGCKGILQAHAAHVYQVEMGSDHILRDIDQPEDYRRLTDG